ncbi:Detected protein of unknown function [Hibiscus syriacus]|uniref:Leucine-rich repeat-containing N-terminal plant-type domain-containing protein n=1 Tax=Hibiscus syriacus TaxID=106335 RepID=A0A6A3BAN6_HIBSY|nr:Detected protein of unknown function [Hibiscus syriacus]
MWDFCQKPTYYAPNFAFSSKFELWDVNTDCCSWEGVTCDALGHVIGLDLSYKNLAGSFHSIFDLHHLQRLNLAGNNFNTTLFSYGFDKLPNLIHLNLSSSCIQGQIPVKISYLTRLVSLDLSSQADCILSGYFPTEILLLPKIQSIDLSYNGQLMGQLPEFSSNSALRSLSLSYTNFSGKLPESIGNLKFLTDLTLIGCNFLGSIPSSIANLSRLEHLNLGNNNFSGLIPPFSRFGVPNLAYLELGGNKLYGSITASLFTLPSLRFLSLGENQLVGKIDEFPNASSSLIEVLSLGNNDLTGLIPSSILQLPRLEWLYLGGNSFSSMNLSLFVQMKNLRDLDLSNISLFIERSNRSIHFPQLEILILGSCNLTEFPGFIKTLDKLTLLDLSNNHIHGVVPNWLWKTTLSYVNLSFNPIDFPKHLPLSDANFSIPMLSHLYLGSYASHNNLSGPIPNCLGNMSSLEYLDLHENNFSGILPDFEKAPNLWVLNVRKNKLEGKLPRSLAECTPLQVLDVGNNMLRDTFPFWLEKLPALKVLILRENRFYGEIKNFKHKIVFPTLDVLDIASNEFSGELSVDFFQASQLRSLKISGNKFEGKLPRSLATCSKLEVLDLGNNMVHDTFPIWLMKSPSLKVLILRENRFHGTIEDLDIGHDFQTCEYWTLLPTIFLYNGGEYYEDSVTIVNKGVELFYEKVLTILTCLDLSNNSFHGRIPEDIHILRSLKVLNLSHNSFSGEIPSALDNLKELESLDLSMNNLEHTTSNQFITFSNGSYIGNPKLCGPPLSRKCNDVGLPMSPPPPGENEEDSWLDAMSTWQIALTSYASCLVAGICIGFTVLNEYGNKWVYKFQKYGKRSRRKFIFQNQLIQSLRNDSVRALSLVWINSGGNDFHALVMFRMVLLRREQARANKGSTDGAEPGPKGVEWLLVVKMEGFNGARLVHANPLNSH